MIIKLSATCHCLCTAAGVSSADSPSDIVNSTGIPGISSYSFRDNISHVDLIILVSDLPLG